MDTILDEHTDRKIVKRIAEESFEWGDLNPKYEGQDSTTGNVFCCFHPNFGTPAAKFYEDEERGIMVLWCFRERRSFTVYDYIDLILVGERKEAQNAKEWIIDEIGERKFNELYEVLSQDIEALDSARYEERVTYINNIASEYDSTTDFIDALYLEVDEV